MRNKKRDKREANITPFNQLFFAILPFLIAKMGTISAFRASLRNKLSIFLVKNPLKGIL